MSAPVITAWQTYSPLGHGADSHREALRSAGRTGGTSPAVQDFEVREILGRAGTRSMDRVAGLAVATTARLLEQIGTPDSRFGSYAPEEVALVLGTSDGFSSVSAFLRDTWTRSKPYDVDPSHVPRTLMNFAAGQCAIRHGIKGPNTTICGSHATGLLTLNYARRLQRNGHARATVWGAVEELSPERVAVEEARLDGPAERPASEGCVMFLLESPGEVPPERTPLAEVLAVEFGVWAETDSIRSALAACLRRALARAEVTADEVFAAAPSDSVGARGAAEHRAVEDVLGSVPLLTATADAVGDARAVSAAFQTVELLDADAAPGRVGVVTTSDAEGRVGCALLRIC
ncbi:3-oxoacyl-ACP synthase [Streptomyces sp. JH14]|uniref:beta-ketoacyl synthase N-terminal-like domain-containing protein n=1 Tax=Streptomyces sp. JH14 TaxID=2793630 RepID=UPI0023F95528|nr:beta-ketoacyl synthase N-terminal-like domain-containing protein [Streptomyces sp. JH14]MDF6043854.1 3-oxoacyl-ACP synthase [Streptomyces sp. JH14]